MNQPVIIIGAGRSGTNMLRDSICALPGFETWPCDEINYIWRHGNIGHVNDRFTEAQARPEVKKYLQHQFQKLQRSTGAHTVVEKTCANSLRVAFIKEIFPNARFIVIERNGYDVASSAMQRWKASLEWRYILRKARYVPVSDLPYYALRYLGNRIKKVFSSEKRLAYWGPLYPGMKEDLSQLSLAEVCATQWKACVEIARNDLAGINPKQLHRLRYEDFVKNPADELGRVFHFLGVEVKHGDLQQVVEGVSPRSIGNYKKHLSEETMAKLWPLVEPVLAEISAANR